MNKRWQWQLLLPFMKRHIKSKSPHFSRYFHKYLVSSNVHRVIIFLFIFFFRDLHAFLFFLWNYVGFVGIPEAFRGMCERTLWLFREFWIHSPDSFFEMLGQFLWYLTDPPDALVDFLRFAKVIGYFIQWWHEYNLQRAPFYLWILQTFQESLGSSRLFRICWVD